MNQPLSRLLTTHVLYDNQANKLYHIENLEKVKVIYHIIQYIYILTVPEIN